MPSVQTIWVAISHPDGHVSRMEFVTFGHFTDGWKAVAPTPAAIQANIDKLIEEQGFEVTGWRFINKADWPSDAASVRYRNSLTDNKGVIEARMPIAKALFRDALRLIRDRKLAEQDALYLRADETRDAVARTAIIAEKQRLRDLPQDPRIDAALTLTELDGLWPTDWPRR